MHRQIAEPVGVDHFPPVIRLLTVDLELALYHLGDFVYLVIEERDNPDADNIRHVGERYVPPPRRLNLPLQTASVLDTRRHRVNAVALRSQ